jgi:hypothetical protein
MALHAFVLNQTRLRANAVSNLARSRAGCQFYHRPMRTRASRETSPRSPKQARIMKHKQYTSAPAADAHATSIEQRTTEQIRTAVSALEQRITSQFQAANVALLAQLQTPTTSHTTTNQQQYTPPDATPTTEGGKAGLEPPIDWLAMNPNRPRLSSSTSPTTAKSSLPGSNVPHAT